MSNIDIEEHLADVLAKEIAAEIDFGVMSEIMISQGWHKVQLDRFANNEEAVDVGYWVEENIKKKHIKYGSTFVFEDRGDAINFTLKWAS